MNQPPREAHIIMAGECTDDAMARLEKLFTSDSIDGFVICTLNRPNDLTKLGVTLTSVGLTPEQTVNVLVNALEGLGISISDLRRLMRL